MSIVPIHINTMSAVCEFRFNRKTSRLAFALCVFLGLALATTHAGTVSVSSSAPAVNGFDIANLGTRTGSDKFWAESGTAAGAAHGQTFQTISAPTWLRAVTYRTTPGNEADPTKTYVVRVGKVTGTSFAQVHTETFTQSIQWGSEQYMTWTFTAPVLLDGDTTYGVDVGMTSSTSTWQTGIPYLSVTADNYLGGQFYSSGGASPGVGNNTLSFTVTSDRHFHLNIDAPTGTPLAFIAGNPPDNSTNALVRAELIGAFNQTLSPGVGNIIIRNVTAGTETSLAATDPRITLSANLLKMATPGLIDWGRSYAIRIEPGALLGTGGVAFVGITNNTTWNFTTSAADPLLAAIAALKSHLVGTTNLTTNQIAAHSRTLDSESPRYAASATNIAALFSLISTYDAEVGPLWVATGDLDRADEADDMTWTIYRTMQGIMDLVYKAPTLAQHEALLRGLRFNCSSNFPGACPTPPTNQTRTVAINASFPDTFGRDTQGWNEPARKPTGTYLAPGTIASVSVPAALVGQGYQIRVGAQSWDMSGRPSVRRLDRSTVLYSITSTNTKIASPLGGGIYIEVPKGRNAGVVNVTITGAARSPYFSAKSFHQTTLSEWVNTERTQPGPWADFQTEKYMVQVPRSWIYALADPLTAMTNWDAAIDACNDLMGFPRVRGKETIYDQVDVLLRASVYAPGYPAVNSSYNPRTTYNGNSTSYLVRGPASAPDYEFHEHGHAYFFPKFDGEQESTVNLLHVAVMTQKFGKTFDQALRESNGNGSFCTLPNAAVLWMTSFNFSPREVPMADWEKAYQPQGHAKFADIARLFGWGGLSNFWYYFNEKDNSGQSYSTSTDSMILQLCKSVGRDVRPMLHFWGIHPVSVASLSNSIAAARLKVTVEVYDRIVQYQGLVPTNNSSYRAFCTNWWGRAPSISGYGVEREHARQWSTNLQNGTDTQARFPTEIFDEAASTQVRARVQEILNLYYPSGRPTDYAAWDATFPGINLSNPAADFDGDGVSNDNERIWGLNPTNAASANAFVSLASLKATGQFTYTRRSTTLTGLNYTVWTSTNLTTWTRDNGATQTINSTVNNVQSVTARLSSALLAQPKLFVRVQAAP
jgi:Peptidase M60, enhancin and enhancin-like/N-terminal domain of M60-like peptidases